MSNLKFSVKFKIFHKFPLNKKEVGKRQKLCEDFHDILKNVAEEFPDKYKYLPRCEPSLCSLDEHKQLRMDFCSMLNQDIMESRYIIFDQRHSCCKEYFSLEELKEICKTIKQEIENYLHYEIDEPILFVHIDDI